MVDRCDFVGAIYGVVQDSEGCLFFVIFGVMFLCKCMEVRRKCQQSHLGDPQAGYYTVSTPSVEIVVVKNK